MPPRPAIAICGLILAAAVCDSPAPARENGVSFSRDVKPLLARKCFACHGPNEQEGGMRLDQPQAALAELDSGARAIVPGRVAESMLIARVSAADEAERMPPEGDGLTTKEIEMLRQWIANGAKFERHWAFVPPQRHEPPVVSHTAWEANPIDAFIVAGLERAGMAPAPAADKQTLARRVFFGVTGLPPTNGQLQAFLDDDAADAWPRLVDSLLATPHFGEHWARHWLDLVRFAETNSFERDGLKPNAWRYRDYVIQSFNDDKPYDQFVREQLAGDELDEVTGETMTATGYYRLGTWDDEPADPLQARYDDLDDILSTTGQAFLGLTIGCARCHDHKIDPISQAEYYGLLAFFADVTPFGDLSTREGFKFSQWDLAEPDERDRRAQLQSKLDKADQQVRDMEELGIARMTASEQEIARTPGRKRLIRDKLRVHLNDAEWSKYEDARLLQRKVQDAIGGLPPARFTLALAQCDAHPAPTRIMLRGNPHVPGEVVQPHYPALFGDAAPVIPPAAKDARSAGRRRVLAEWITSPRNLLTARVIVNRIWQHHFGRGLVRTPNNFGELGTPPTHPELLDFLALWLVDHNWQLKPLHRLILTSNTYRMSSANHAQAYAADPTNDLFWRFDMRRLAAEEIHDAALVVTGEFNDKMFGQGFFPSLSQEVLNTQSRPGQGWGKSSSRERARRSVYMHIKRSLLPPLLTAFDFPDVDATCEARFITTQPGQALTMLHGEFLNERAGKLAARVVQEAGPDPKAQVAQTIRLALGRPAADEEIVEGLDLIHRLTADRGQKPADALRYWCLTVLNSNEFVYLD